MSHPEALLFSDLFIHLPCSVLEQRLPAFLELRWQPEIAVQARDLDCLSPADVTALGRQLRNFALRCCIHAPFFDLNPASTDPDIRAVTLQRFEQTLALAAEIGAQRIVFHPGFDPWRYARAPHSWLDNSLDFWPQLVERARNLDLMLCIENIFESEPTQLARLLSQIDSPHFRHCFDVGHWHLFSKIPLERWLEELGPFLAHLHLHDNRGRRDDHLPIGKGKIDFNALLRTVASLPKPPTATLEAHNHKDALASLRAWQTLLKR